MSEFSFTDDMLDVRDLIERYEELEDELSVITDIEDEIATIYSHLEELNRLKKNKKGGSKDSLILSNNPDELEDNTGENEEE